MNNLPTTAIIMKTENRFFNKKIGLGVIIVTLSIVCTLEFLYLNNHLGEKSFKRYQPILEKEANKYVQLDFFSQSGEKKTRFKAELPTAEGWDLGGKGSLLDTEGLLCVSEESHPHNFAMKNMTIPLDIVWINNNKVVDLDYNAQPPFKGQPTETLKRYSPKEDINKFIAINAGLAKKYGIEIGDTIKTNPSTDPPPKPIGWY